MPHDNGRDDDQDKRAMAKVDSPIEPELMETLKRELGQNINVNVVLHQVVQKTPDVDKMLEASAKLFEQTSRFERQRLEHFKDVVNAMIDMKTRDPDEIDKRANNHAKRSLKNMVAVVSFLSVVLGGVIALFIPAAAAWVVAGFLTLAVLAVGMTATLAGGDVTAGDVVKMLREAKGLIPFTSERGMSNQGRKGKRR